MSASASSEVSSHIEQRRDGVAAKDSSSILGSRNLSNGNDLVVHPTPRSTLPRHWTSFQEHADSVGCTVTPGNGSTPRPENRREGFMWEIPLGGNYHESRHPRKSSSTGSNLTIHKSRVKPVTGRRTSICAFDTAESPPQRDSTESFITHEISCDSTSLSSVSSIAHGLLGVAPDLTMLNAIKKKYENRSGGTATDVPTPVIRRSSNPSRRLSFRINPKIRRARSEDKERSKPTGIEPVKRGLKDRRKLDNADAMKLTLPLGLPNLPPRQRTPITPIPPSLPQIGSNRSRSPKFPWVRDCPPEWPTMEISPPSTIQETPCSGDNKHGHGLLPGSDPIFSSQGIPKGRERPGLRGFSSRPRMHRRSASQRSDISPVTSPLSKEAPNYLIKTEELHQLGQQRKQAKRSRRWRWSAPFTSGDIESADSPSRQLTDSPQPFPSRLRAPWKRQAHTPPPSAAQIPPSDSPSSMYPTNPWLGMHTPATKPPTHPMKDPISSFPVPPMFVPPGVQRVSTPPLFDETREIRGKLAKFYFDIHGVKHSRPSPCVQAGVWDSDALLMPQESNITPKSGSEDESPQGISVSGNSPLQLSKPSSSQPRKSPAEYFAAGAGRSGAPFSAPVLTNSAVFQDLYHVHQREDERKPNSGEIEGVEDVAILEWLIPEHLPSSPLCPLHPKYRGPSRICVYHGRRKDKSREDGLGDGVVEDDEGGDSLRREKGWAKKRRRRRLISFSGQ
ncbi:uncharacterized protein BDR25DRAFT_88967 [Lindgomyces ingoldianus]|uniref:Uncharacterized protein n=1 Tax=Lindgomyces ingoldianus TaxID=673940 RepID=A0ACB6R933_9PLEO|nr:uncharacterized protein BDR25DRAFT_88967 [Lindgomyces ingoldianus]KAF2475833.1 hypothetical protein BDR25DRAFT_88967 [Lindgomyces ingoldianus]